MSKRETSLCPICDNLGYIGCLCGRVKGEVMAEYTIEPGRNIYRNGEPFIYIGVREGVVGPGGPIESYSEADDIARMICSLLNKAIDEDLERAERKASGE